MIGLGISGRYISSLHFPRAITVTCLTTSAVFILPPLAAALLGFKPSSTEKKASSHPTEPLKTKDKDKGDPLEKEKAACRKQVGFGESKEFTLTNGGRFTYSKNWIGQTCEAYSGLTVINRT